MTLSVEITRVGTAAASSRPVLVLGPSLGTSAQALWGEVAAALAEQFTVFTWDLPGHGHSPPSHGDYTMAQLSEAVLAAVDGATNQPFAYAGDSIGAAVGLQLLLDHPDRVLAATLLCTGARIGNAESWTERAAFVRANGTAAMVEGSRVRWFAPGFPQRRPAVAEALLDSLRRADADSYSHACAALAKFDTSDQLHRITTPVLAVAGACDQPTPVESLRDIAQTVRHGRLVVLDDVAHLAPAENPAQVAMLIAEHSRPSGYQAGMRVRREVLGEAHVDRATAAATDLTGEFQEFITRYAWGEIWTRPGLDRRARSMITLTALVARGHHDELAMHLRAARTNGLTDAEITELLLQTAIYCGVPAANTAFRIAQQVLGGPN